MKANDYWNLFLETGSPEIYLLYNNARKMENNHVLDDTGIGSAGQRIQ